VELLMVLTIAGVVSTIAVPAMVNSSADLRLRTSASGLAGLMQRCRMMAVAEDSNYPVHTDSSGTMAWVDVNNNSALNPAPSLESNLVLQLPSGITLTGSSAPSNATMGLDFTAQAALPAFNARGLPCSLSGATCPVQAGTGYLYYLRQERMLGTTAWAAVSVTPAGRIRAWIWDGNAWQ
jgi:Tfp pilus assembly protein FimT